ncbi:MAG: hypothetical protein L0Z54_03370 [Thermoplasmata archaeon]|nr:hypothetical protein [Thermoplasmata archaeon]
MDTMVAVLAGIGLLVVAIALVLIGLFLWPLVVCCCAVLLLLVGLWFLNEAVRRSRRGRRRAVMAGSKPREPMPTEGTRGEDGWQE